MGRIDRKHPFGDLQSLRLFALGRIPRCGECARYRVFLSSISRLGGAGEPLPPVPNRCSYQACAPLATRYTIAHERQRGADGVLRIGAGGPGSS